MQKGSSLESILNAILTVNSTLLIVSLVILTLPAFASLDLQKIDLFSPKLRLKFWERDRGMPWDSEVTGGGGNRGLMAPVEGSKLLK